MNEPVVNTGIEHSHPGMGLEHSFLGGSLDTGFGSAFKSTPELRELQERYLANKNERQHMTIATSMFAMACPIMPLGFLAALFVLGKLDGLDKDPFEEMEESRSLKGDMARFAAAAALMRKRKDAGEDPESDAYLKYASREMELRPLRQVMRPLKGSEKRVIPKQQQSRDSLDSPSYFITREKQAKEREIKRQKIMLESLSDKERKESPIEANNKLSEKLDKLDQLLRKMGA
jgi:hypothetical protein